MFDRRRPCSNCPFRVGMGSLFRLTPDRLDEIREAPAFQCHKTVDYGADRADQGDRPQQCAGLMAVLLAEGDPNTIMQVGMRLGALDPARLEGASAYARWEDVLSAHRTGQEPPKAAWSAIHETETRRT